MFLNLTDLCSMNLLNPAGGGTGEMKRIATGAVTLLLVGSSCGQSDTTPEKPQLVRVAVPANFAVTLEALTRRFQEETGIAVEVSLGSTGQLYAQIRNGAPYDVFLAADVERPRLLEETNAAVTGSRFTYAVGRLVLYAPKWDSLRSGDIELREREFQHLAIANPLTAPYGTAAQQVLERLDLWHGLQDRIVRGESVGQVLQFVHSGAAEVGFVSLSQVISLDATRFWITPDSMHEPIRQDAVLLRQGDANPAAKAFLDFLRSHAGRQVIANFGYTQP